MITKLTIASAIGTARMPTQGSCRPTTSISTSLPSLSTVLPFFLILEVGLIKKSSSILSPLEIPPKIPPALFDAKPSDLISSRISDPFEI